MGASREWLHRLMGTIRPRRRDDELAEELRLHADLAAERGGRVTGSSQAMDALRDQRGLPWLDDLGRDIRYGLRTLTRSKGFTATALISLALGIGANAGIFTLLDQVLLRPLPVREAERLVQLAWQGNKVGANYGAGPTVSYPFCLGLEQQDKIFDGVFCRHPTEVYLSTGGEQQPARAEIVSGSYFRALGVSPALGRLIGPSDNRDEGAHPVVVLSHDYWRNTLSAARDIVGRRVFVNSHPMTVIGVAPPGFRGVDRSAATALWIPATMIGQANQELDGGLDTRRVFWMHALGRLRPDVTAEQARARLQPWFRRMLESDLQREDFPPVSPDQRRSFLASALDVQPAGRGVEILQASLDRPLRVLMAGAALLLVLASLNVAGLLLARGVARTREVATRMAVGASRGRVARQLLVESLLITAGGGVLGVTLAPLVSRVLRSFVPVVADVTADIDGRVLMFALAVSVITGAVCGVAPVFQLRRLALSAVMTERSGGMGRRGARMRKVLVGGQIAFALVLLVTAGLFVRTLSGLYAKGAGFDTTNLMMFSLDPGSSGYSNERAEQAMRELLRRLQEEPEIKHAAVASFQVLSGGRAGGALTIDVFGERRVTDRIVYRMRVSPGFIDTLGMKLIDGRDYQESDVRPAGEKPGPLRMAIVNETFARRYFGTRSPVGALVGPGNRPDVETNIPIVGVVREISRVNMRDRDVDQIFYNFWDNQSQSGVFYVRVRHPESAAAAIRALVADMDPRLTIGDMTTLDDQIERALANERALATLSTGFGVLALVISIVGLYGVMAFVAAQRRQEIGLRVALGATRGDAVWLVVRDALLMVAVGIAVALPAVWGLRQLVETQLFDVKAFDGLTIAVAAIGLGLIALAAAWLPAWRASRLDPNAALRVE
jgi:predicted permease